MSIASAQRQRSPSLRRDRGLGRVACVSRGAIRGKPRCRLLSLEKSADVPSALSLVRMPCYSGFGQGLLALLNIKRHCWEVGQMSRQRGYLPHRRRQVEPGAGIPRVAPRHGRGVPAAPAAAVPLLRPGTLHGRVAPGAGPAREPAFVRDLVQATLRPLVASFDRPLHEAYRP